MNVAVNKQEQFFQIFWGKKPKSNSKLLNYQKPKKDFVIWYKKPNAGRGN